MLKYYYFITCYKLKYFNYFYYVFTHAKTNNKAIMFQNICCIFKYIFCSESKIISFNSNVQHN